MIDFDARYEVEGYGGIAFYLVGYAEHEELYFDEFLEQEMLETVEDDTMVRAVMVGDDREFIVGVDEISEINDEDYCSGCGQIGCGHG